MMPYFSVIVPVYNVAPYLREALDSVLAQTFTDWECLCVDDGSTDGSGKILDEYAAKDARFRIFHKENGGVSIARNLALNKAKGEYVSFLDGDDVLLPKRLEIAHEHLSETNADLLRLRAFKWDDSESVDYDALESSELLNTYISHSDVLTWGVPFFLSKGYLHGVFLRMSLAKSVRFVEYMAFREDNIYMLEVLHKVQTCAVGADAGYLYRQREGSAVHSELTYERAVSFLKEVIRVQKSYDCRFHKNFCTIVTDFLYDVLSSSDVNHSNKEDIANLKEQVRDIFAKGLVFRPQTLFYRRWCIILYNECNIAWPSRLTQTLLLFQYRIKPKSWRGLYQRRDEKNGVI